MAGKWLAQVEIDPTLNLVRCSSDDSVAGRQYTYEASTERRDAAGEYGTAQGHLYVRVEVGPDGAGEEKASVIATWNDGDLFSAYQSTTPLQAGSSPELAFRRGSDRKSIQVSAIAVAGPEFDYARSDGIGSISLTVSIVCP